MKKRDPRRRLLLQLRKTIHVSQRLKVEYLGEGCERLSCRECEFAFEQNVGGVVDLSSVDLKILERLGLYRAKGSIQGECPACTAKERESALPAACEADRDQAERLFELIAIRRETR